MAHAQSTFDQRKLSAEEGSLVRTINLSDGFGTALAYIGDIDGDNIDDLAVGTPNTQLDRRTNVGAVWILRLNADGSIKAQQQITSGQGNFSGVLDSDDTFGASVAPVGDLNGDDVPDIVVGAPNQSNTGAIWILYLNSDGSVADQKEVIFDANMTEDPLPTNGSNFGRSIALYEKDGDGTIKLAVGAPETNDDENTGAVWILSLDANQDISTASKIDFSMPTDTSCMNIIRAGDQFGTAVAGIGDINSDGIQDLAVGAPKADVLAENGDITTVNTGEIWVLQMENDRTAKTCQQIGQGVGNFPGNLEVGDEFGTAIANSGDINGDGITDLAVGIPDEGANIGAAWILLLDAEGKVKGESEMQLVIDADEIDDLDEDDRFGSAIAVHTNTTTHLVVGAPGRRFDQSSTALSSSIWFIEVNSNPLIVDNSNELAVGEDELDWALASEDQLGTSLTSLGDLNGDGFEALVAGAPFDSDEAGAVWIFHMEPDTTTSKVRSRQKIDSNVLGQDLAESRFGYAVSGIGDWNRDGFQDLAVGAPYDTENKMGAVWLLMLNEDGTIKESQKIGTDDSFEARNASDEFGSSLAAIHDLDGDNFPELAIGAPMDGDQGALWVVFSSNQSQPQKIVPSSISEGDDFGASIVSLGNIDNSTDNSIEIAVGAPGDDDGNVSNSGAVRILSLNAVGTIVKDQKISLLSGNFQVGESLFLDQDDRFGASLGLVGDRNGDAIPELAVGVPFDDDGSVDAGAVWILFLDENGFVTDREKIGSERGGFPGVLRISDKFGTAVTSLGDINNDDVVDLIVGAPFDDDGGSDTGAIWVLPINQDPTFENVPDSEVDPWEAGVPFAVNILINDTDFIPANPGVDIFFRTAGEPEFDKADMTAPDSSTYTFRIPGIYLQTPGLEYYIEVTDSGNKVNRVPDSGIISQRVKTEGAGIIKSTPQPSDVYNLISIPFNVTFPSPDSVLVDDFGPYKKHEWRLFEPMVNMDENTVTYAEYLDVDLTFTPGKVFALIVNGERPRIDIGPGNSLHTDRKFSIALNQGWNFFGSPFNFSIPTTNLSTTLNQSIDLLYRFEDLEAGPISMQVASSSFLDPFEGYLIWSTQMDTLLIDPFVCPDGNMDDSLCPDRTEPEVVPASYPGLPIRITARNGNLRDDENIILLTERANRDWDVLDRPDTPRIGDYVALYFPRDGWEKLAKNYTIDARPMPDLGDEWSFEVVSSRSGKVDLMFEGLDAVPPHYQVYLWDRVNNIRHNLRENPNYAVPGVTKGSPRAFVVYMGSDDFLRGTNEPRLPEEFELFQNYPNPFKASTTIRYGLPNASPVSLSIYDILGRKIVSLVEVSNQLAGYHITDWDGLNRAGVPVSSGVYFVHADLGGKIITRKLILID